MRRLFLLVFITHGTLFDKEEAMSEDIVLEKFLADTDEKRKVISWCCKCNKATGKEERALGLLRERGWKTANGRSWCPYCAGVKIRDQIAAKLGFEKIPGDDTCQCTMMCGGCSRTQTGNVSFLNRMGWRRKPSEYRCAVCIELLVKAESTQWTPDKTHKCSCCGKVGTEGANAPVWFKTKKGSWLCVVCAEVIVGYEAANNMRPVNDPGIWKQVDHSIQDWETKELIVIYDRILDSGEAEVHCKSCDRFTTGTPHHLHLNGWVGNRGLWRCPECVDNNAKPNYGFTHNREAWNPNPGGTFAPKSYLDTVVGFQLRKPKPVVIVQCDDMSEPP